MELFNYFHLFTFVPVVAVGGIFWFERMYRHGAQKRTVYLFLSLVILAAVGVFQMMAWTLRDTFPADWAQLFVCSTILYYLAFLVLEYAIHVKRIDESFLSQDFSRALKSQIGWVVVVGLLGALIMFLYGTFDTVPTNFPLNFLLSDEQKYSAILGYDAHMRILTPVFTAFMVILWLIAARSLFNLQEGVIRMRGYTFYFQIAVALAILIHQFAQPVPHDMKSAADQFLPISWYVILNIVFAVRLVEEFYFWSQYNLRSDRNKIEQRQHMQNLLIRRVISSAEEEEKVIIFETVENSMEKMSARMVVQEYRITGIMVMRSVGNILRVDDVSHIIGYCTPLVDNKNIKNFDTKRLTDTLLHTTFDLTELRESLIENIKDFGKKIMKTVMVQKQTEVISEMPESFKGLQRLFAVVPIFDGNNFVGALIVFKDSFDKLYPAEKELLNELAENLGTIFSLMSTKAVQRERNRLKGEMDTARNIQTSILPKKIQMEGFTVGSYMQTASEVGGDVYDFIATPFGQYFGIGDVSGHGLPAGMMAVIATSAFHGAIETSRTMKKELKVDELYDIVNRALCTINRDRIGSDKFMTQNYFIEQKGKITHAGSHLIGLLYHKDRDEIEELTNLQEKTAFLGLSEFVVSSQSVGSFVMNKDDVLILYSDGVIEAKHANGTLFGLQGLKDSFLEVREQKPDDILAHILERVNKFAEGGDKKKYGGTFADDVSLLIIRKD
jgi:sigma-B regulation protein RsbU (phosphoserine phosphatase)